MQGTAELLRNPAEAARLARPDRDTGATPPPELLERLGEDAAACAEADGVYSPRCDAARQSAGDLGPIAQRLYQVKPVARWVEHDEARHCFEGSVRPVCILRIATSFWGSDLLQCCL